MHTRQHTRRFLFILLAKGLFSLEVFAVQGSVCCLHREEH